MLANHPPYLRVISDEASAQDRQWLRLLSEAFDEIDHESLCRAGMDARFATEVLGIVALNTRYSTEAV